MQVCLGPCELNLREHPSALDAIENTGFVLSQATGDNTAENEAPTSGSRLVELDIYPWSDLGVMCSDVLPANGAVWILPTPEHVYDYCDERLCSGGRGRLGSRLAKKLCEQACGRLDGCPDSVAAGPSFLWGGNWKEAGKRSRMFAAESSGWRARGCKGRSGEIQNTHLGGKDIGQTNSESVVVRGQ